MALPSSPVGIHNQPLRLDQKIQWLQTMGPVEVWQYDRTTGPAFWFEVPQSDVVRWLSLGEANAAEAPLHLPLDISYWNRVKAIQQRVLEHFARLEASWKARKRLSYQEGTGKAPSQSKMEDMYRTDAEYPKIKGDVEAAQERLRHVEAICAGLEARDRALRYIVPQATK